MRIRGCGGRGGPVFWGHFWYGIQHLVVCRVNREPGANPGLSRSGKRERGRLGLRVRGRALANTPRAPPGRGTPRGAKGMPGSRLPRPVDLRVRHALESEDLPGGPGADPPGELRPPRPGVDEPQAPPGGVTGEETGAACTPRPVTRGGERSVDPGKRGPKPSSRSGTRHRHDSSLRSAGDPRVSGPSRWRIPGNGRNLGTGGNRGNRPTRGVRRSTRPRGIPLRPSVRTG